MGSSGETEPVEDNGCRTGPAARRSAADRDELPAVEGAYRTYARTAAADGVRASRDHRAFSGFSMGAVSTGFTFLDVLDLFRYFLPLAGDCWRQLARALEQSLPR